MSLNTEIRVTCPSCQQDSTTTVWNSINVSLDPHLKQALFDHTLNTLTCSCGTVTEIATELLYHDMDRQYQVWLHPPDDDGTITLDSVSLGFAKSVLSGYRLRIVRSRNQLLEKVRIFDSGYDDRVVEVLKFALWRQLIGDREPPQDRMFFLDADAPDPRRDEGSLAVVILDESGEPTSYDIATGIYERVSSLLLARGSTSLFDDTGWRIIGREFARALWTPSLTSRL